MTMKIVVFRQNFDKCPWNIGQNHFLLNIRLLIWIQFQSDGLH